MTTAITRAGRVNLALTAAWCLIATPLADASTSHPDLVVPNDNRHAAGVPGESFDPATDHVLVLGRSGITSGALPFLTARRRPSSTASGRRVSCGRPAGGIAGAW